MPSVCRAGVRRRVFKARVVGSKLTILIQLWDVESSIKVIGEAEGELAGRIATLVEVGKEYNTLDDSRTWRSARHRSVSSDNFGDR